MERRKKSIKPKKRNFSQKVKRERSAGAIIFRKGGGNIYYLLLHYESGHWGFPKGHIEAGESEKETIRREIKEETGIENIHFIKGLKGKITYFFKEKHGKEEKAPLVFKEVIFYLAETEKKEIKISFEHIGFAWLKYKEAIAKITFKNSKDILKKASSFLSKNRII